MGLWNPTSRQGSEKRGTRLDGNAGDTVLLLRAVELDAAIYGLASAKVASQDLRLLGSSSSPRIRLAKKEYMSEVNVGPKHGFACVTLSPKVSAVPPGPPAIGKFVIHLTSFRQPMYRC
jgi:hypothetical protein